MGGSEREWLRVGRNTIAFSKNKFVYHLMLSSDWDYTRGIISKRKVIWTRSSFSFWDLEENEIDEICVFI